MSASDETKPSCCLPNIFVSGMVTKLWTVSSWPGARRGNNPEAISSGWGQNGWDSALHDGPPVCTVSVSGVRLPSIFPLVVE